MLRLAPPPAAPSAQQPAGPPQPPAGGGGGLPPQLAALMQGGPDDLGGGDDSGSLSPRFDAQKVSPETARYMGPEMGPFACQHCTHFEGPGSCAIVSGKIDPAGFCNIFESADNPEVDAPPDPGAPLPTE